MNGNDVLIIEIGKRNSEHRKSMNLSQKESAELPEAPPQLLSYRSKRHKSSSHGKSS